MRPRRGSVGSTYGVDLNPCRTCACRTAGHGTVLISPVVTNRVEPTVLNETGRPVQVLAKQRCSGNEARRCAEQINSFSDRHRVES